MTFSSVYEMTNPLTTVRKQHFWDWFSGDSPKTLWTSNVTGSSTATMADSVNGGLLLTTGAAAGNRIELTFGNTGKFIAHDGSVSIGTMTLNNTSDISSRVGMISGVLIADLSHAWLGVDISVSSTHFFLGTFATGANDTATTVTLDTNQHVFKVENNGSSTIGTIDGLSAATNTTQLPDSNMEPHLSTQAKIASARTANFGYYEAYNT